MFQITREFEFMADSLPQIIWTANPDGNLDYFNQSWYKFTGLSYKESAGLGIYDIIHPDEKEETAIRWEKSFEQGLNFEMEYRIKGADQSYKWFIGRALPMRNNEGQIIKWFGTCTDIQKQKEQTRRFEEISIEFQKINGDLDNFIYTASHELKAPVSNIEGLMDVLKEVILHKKEDEDCELMVDFMQKSINQLYITINELINVTMIQRGLLITQTSPVNLENILGSVIDDLRANIESARSEINIELNEKEILFEPDSAKSLIYNLLSNSIKFRSPDRKNKISIESYRLNGHTVLCVRDNGLGINPEKQGKLLSSFRKLNEHSDGSGVGLYTVKRMVENVGGKIEVDGREGEGCEFRIYLRHN